MQTNKIINLKEIEKTIPAQNYNQQQKNLKEKYTEWCMTKYRIDNKTYVTISICYPNDVKLIYLTADGERNIDEVPVEYDKFIIEKKYWYGID
jgi:glutathione peroxidase-family protein